MSADLLPPNSTPLERALAMAAARISAIDVPIDRMWSPETIPAAFLPWLAWSLSVDNWDPLWSEDEQRRAVAASIEVHRHKGSVRSAVTAIEAAGLGIAQLVEGWSNARYDGAILHDGSVTHAASDHWAEYRINLLEPVSVAQAAMVRRILADTAPARSHLKAFDFTAVSNIHNGAILYDGAYTHGVA